MYKFDEDESLDEIKKYIDKTYEAHYSKGTYQTQSYLNYSVLRKFCQYIF
jgi:hypothetical protein